MEVSIFNLFTIWVSLRVEGSCRVGLIQTDFSKTLNYGARELIGMSARKLLGIKNSLVLMRFNEFIPDSLCEGLFKRHR